MIVRVWHGRTSRDKADEYAAFLVERAMPDYLGTEGNQGAFILRRDDADCEHFLTVSLWPSIEIVRNFAGAEYEAAKYYPEDKDFLLEFEEKVQHYEVVDGKVKQTWQP